MTSWPRSFSVYVSVCLSFPPSLCFFPPLPLSSSMLHSPCDTMSLLWGTCSGRRLPLLSSPELLSSLWTRAALLYGLLKSPGDAFSCLSLSASSEKSDLEDKACKTERARREDRGSAGWERRKADCKNKANTWWLLQEHKTAKCVNGKRHSAAQHLAPVYALMHFAEPCYYPPKNG